MRTLGIAVALTLLALANYPKAEAQSGIPHLPCVTDSPRLCEGVEVSCDYPATRHRKNIGGRDGAGLCVFTSVQHAADWQHLQPLGNDFQKWMSKQPGGGWPEKLTKMVREFCSDTKEPMPDMLQNVNGDLNLLTEAVNKGYLAGITYCRSPTGRYGGQTIAHMINCMGARLGPNKDIWCVMDNNFPGSYEWMDEKDFVRSFRGNGGNWFVIFLDKPQPPPIPRNSK